MKSTDTRSKFDVKICHLKVMCVKKKKECVNRFFFLLNIKTIDDDTSGEITITKQSPTDRFFFRSFITCVYKKGIIFLIFEKRKFGGEFLFPFSGKIVHEPYMNEILVSRIFLSISFQNFINIYYFCYILAVELS